MRIVNKGASPKPGVSGITIRHAAGFTLVELAVVLLILGLLLGGLLAPISVQLEQQSIKDTQRKLDEIKEALIGFSLANGRLPCPADGATPSGSSGSGEESYNSTTGQCNITTDGVVPWATLALPETDAWGRRFTYRVRQDWADQVNPAASATADCTEVAANASFALCSEGNITVKDGSGASGKNVAKNVPAVIVSHGKNGYGAYLPNGTRLPLSGDSDEQENTDNDATFVSRSPGKYPDDLYDDQVVWISPSILKNRMVQAGRLP
jgi:prepilin-type N-terminal cleavage/methylation domain-containing protein